MRAGPCLPLLPISTQQPTHSKDSTSSHSFVQQIQPPRASVSPITGMGGPQPTSHQADHAGSSPVFPPNRRCSSCHALSLLKVSALLSPLDDSHQQGDMSHYLSSLKEKRKKNPPDTPNLPASIPVLHSSFKAKFLEGLGCPASPLSSHLQSGFHPPLPRAALPRPWTGLRSPQSPPLSSDSQR